MSYLNKNNEYYTMNTELNNRIDEIILFRDYINQVLEDIKMGLHDIDLINKIAQYGEKIMNKQNKFNPRVIISNNSSESDFSDSSDVESDIDVLTDQLLDNQNNSNVSSISYNVQGYTYDKPNNDYKKYYTDELETTYKPIKNNWDDLYNKYEKYDSLAKFSDKKTETSNFEIEKKPFYSPQNYLTQNYPQYNYGTNNFGNVNSQIYSNIVETETKDKTNTDENTKKTTPNIIVPANNDKVDILAVNFIKNNIELDKYNYLKSFNLDRINNFCQNYMKY
jgi:hypothetical protein